MGGKEQLKEAFDAYQNDRSQKNLNRFNVVLAVQRRMVGNNLVSDWINRWLQERGNGQNNSAMA